MYAVMACDWDKPRLLRHAFSLARSAGDFDLRLGLLPPPAAAVADLDDDADAEDEMDVVSGASDATACLCNAYNSSLSRLVGVRLGVQFFIWATLARKSDAVTLDDAEFAMIACGVS